MGKSILWVYGFRFAIVLVFSCAIQATANAIEPSYQSLKQAHHYVSWQGIEPDKWSSIWLIKRYISERAFIQFYPPNSPTPESDAIKLDMPGAALSRGPDHSLFNQFKNLLPDAHPELEYLDEIIYDIEVHVWERPKHPHSVWFEAMFRQLQERYRRDLVPAECYLLFFDRVAELSSQANITSLNYQTQLSLTEECPGLAELDFNFVAQISQREVLDLIGMGKSVVFVDTREDEEFDEVRLPGARLLRLREVSAETVEAFKNADLVVPYCVKDFRGFEVAKAIKSVGVKHVATLSPNGLKGWLASGLPVEKGNEASSERATSELFVCAMEPAQCLAEGRANVK